MHTALSPMTSLPLPVLASDYASFGHSDISFEISLRNFPGGDFSLLDYIQLHYSFLALEQVAGIYAFSEGFTRLYGGRSFDPGKTIKPRHLEEIYQRGIHYYIPLTNHFVTPEAYEESRHLLEEHYRPGNIVVCVSDELARWLRRDYPGYRLAASVIKNLTAPEQIEAALDLYDEVVLPPQLNDRLDVLDRFREKQRLILFANNNCRYTCPAWTCYRGISQGIRDVAIPFPPGGSASMVPLHHCSKFGPKAIARQELGYVRFNLDIFRGLGFKRFKLIPPQSDPVMARMPMADTEITHQDRRLFVVSAELKGRLASPGLHQAILSASEPEKTMLRRLDILLAPFEQGAAPADCQGEIAERARVGETQVAGALQTAISHGLLALKPPVFESPIFIVSAPRSGSTLLFETLAASPALWTIGEENHLALEQDSCLSPFQSRDLSNRLTAARATAEVAAMLKERFAARLVDAGGQLYQARSHSPARVRLLEKTPKNSLRVSFLKQVFPDARFIWLYREPAPAISSIMEGWRSGRFVTYPKLNGWSLERWSFLLPPGWQGMEGRSLAAIAAFQWRSAQEHMLGDLAELPDRDWTVVRYDDFMAAPAATIATLCRWLDLEFGPELAARTMDPLPLAKHTVTPPDPEKWRRNLKSIEPQVAAMADFLALLEPTVASRAGASAGG